MIFFIFYQEYFPTSNNSEANIITTTQNIGNYGPERNPVIVVQDFTPKGGSCLTWGGVHYKTFDGKIYR